MKTNTFALIACLAASTSAFAGHDHKSDKRDRHSDYRSHQSNKGAEINRKFDRKAAKAARHGDYEKAARLDRKGDRIERKFDQRHAAHGRANYRTHFNHNYRYANSKHHHKQRHYTGGHYKPTHYRSAHNRRGHNSASINIHLPGVSLHW
jgi:hypothetical protein